MVERETLGISVGRNVAYVNEWGTCASGIVVGYQLIQMARVNLHMYSIELPSGSIEQVRGDGIFGKEYLVFLNSYPEFEERIKAYFARTRRNPTEGFERFKDVLSQLASW